MTPAATLRALLATGFRTRLGMHMDALAQVIAGLRTNWVIQLGTEAGKWKYNLRQQERPVQLQSFLGQRLRSLMDEFQRQSCPDQLQWLLTLLLTPGT